ncbi:hypothetical protein [Ferrimonas aestuarii]|uniref:hypothetical protein n=1 Tax=Ferrimonas aestuarii TaxID=2569539 RepID=UPI00145C6C23|nr:hypothetical protein [Ferrimonas aestuarii]
MRGFELFVRLVTAILRIVNRGKSKRYQDDPARAIAGDDGSVQQSQQTFSELAKQSRSDRVK